MKLSVKIALFPLTLALLGVVAGGCNEDDDNNFPEKEGKLLVTKAEVRATYMDESWKDVMGIADYDLTEMKYNEQGEMTEWWSNGDCVGRYTYTEGKIIVRDDPDLGPFEHTLSPEGKVVETLYADGGRDKLVYDEKGQCVEIDYHEGYTILFQWTEDQVTSISYLNMADPSAYRMAYRIYYTDIPKKSNAAYLRFMMLNTGGYFISLEVSGYLDISSDKYLPAKAVLEYEDGYTIVYEATYDLNPDGTVKTMHVTLSDGWISSPETTYMGYKGDVTFTYMER